MDWIEGLRAIVVSTIVRDLPQRFWEDARSQTRQTYLDTYHEVQANPNFVDEQRLDMLYQLRHFRMEKVLMELARRHGFAVSPTLLSANSRHYVYATKGAIGLTQAYVPTIGALPKPANYRGRLAAMADIPIAPRLDLGDEPRDVLLGKDFYGLFAHNPAGRRFRESEQRLGMLQFCIPDRDFSDWVIELTIEEILSAFRDATPEPKLDRRLQWKKRGKEKGEGQ